MAIESKGMLEKCKAIAERMEEKRAEVIAPTLFDAGIISKLSQREIAGDTLRKAWAYYVSNVLSAEAGKKSTGVGGKAVDVGMRCKMHIARNTSMKVTDVSCRTAGKADIVVYCDEEATAEIGKSRIAVELKTGAGTVVSAESLTECWNTLAMACEAGKWIAWFFDVKNVDWFAANAWDKLDQLPCIFLPIDYLLNLLESYNGSLETWFKAPSDTTLNFQNIDTSEKKLGYLYSIMDEYSYDWYTFRDTGKLVRNNE